MITYLTTFSFRLVVDIILSLLLVYGICKMLKGTNALSILIAIFFIFGLWVLAFLLDMKIISKILYQFISVGVIGIIIIFQPEIRRYFTMIGAKSIERGKKRRFLFWRIDESKQQILNSTDLVQAYGHLSEKKTGALIVLPKTNDLEAIVHSGELLDCAIDVQLIETIFFKNTPLHDGAMIIQDNRIKAARCILPVSNNYDIPAHLGLRHRSAIGITEQTDAIAITVSEETGHISFAKAGLLVENISLTQLQETLDKEFNS